MLPYGRQTIEEDDVEAVTEALKADFLTTGPKVAEFEEALCKHTGAKYAVAVANGTVALHLACLMLDLKEDDCVIVPTITFLATANAVRYCGADVVFADVDPDTGLMTASTLEAAIDKAKSINLQIKAVMPVHLAGQPVDLEAIHAIANREKIFVIADSCHALGSQYQSNPVGSCIFEDMATYSFHPVKTIALGEGGAITTNNKEWANRMRVLRHHGMVGKPEEGPWVHEMSELGFNYRLTDIQSALGVSQLNKLDLFLEKREKYAAMYDKLLADLSPVLKTPHRASEEKIGWHLYALRIDFEKLAMTRSEFMNALKEKKIGSQVHYIPVHTQPYYEDLYGKNELVGANHYYERTLSIPLYPTLTEEDVRYVSQSLHELLA